MIEAELSEIVEGAEVMQKCHLPICAVMHFGRPDKLSVPGAATMLDIFISQLNCIATE